MADKKSQIKDLLGQGLSNQTVADAVGVDPAYVTQLLDDEQFKADVIAARMLKAGGAVRRDDNINRIEDKLIDALEQNIDTRAPFMKTNELLSAFKTLNLARRRGAVATATMAEGVVVNLTLPKKHLDKFTMTITPEGEVIGVEKQTLVTMSSAQVLELLPEDQKRQAAKRLPSLHRVATYGTTYKSADFK